MILASYKIDSTVSKGEGKGSTLHISLEKMASNYENDKDAAGSPSDQPRTGDSTSSSSIEVLNYGSHISSDGYFSEDLRQGSPQRNELNDPARLLFGILMNIQGQNQIQQYANAVAVEAVQDPDAHPHGHEQSPENHENESNNNPSKNVLDENSQKESDGNNNDKTEDNPSADKNSEQSQCTKSDKDMTTMSVHPDNATENPLHENAVENLKSNSTLFEHAADAVARSPNRWHGELSNDGSSDTQGAVAGAASAMREEKSTMTEEKSTEVKYVRLKFSRHGAVTEEFVNELELYGSDTTARYIYLGAKTATRQPVSLAQYRALMLGPHDSEPEDETSESPVTYSGESTYSSLFLPAVNDTNRATAASDERYEEEVREGPVRPTQETVCETTPLLSQPNSTSEEIHNFYHTPYEEHLAGKGIVTCKECQESFYEKKFSRLGVCLAVACFPCGIFCCYKLRKNVCPVCKATEYGT